MTERPGDVSRRHLLKQAGLAGAVATAPASAQAQAPAPASAFAAHRPEAMETLNGGEMDALEAICARLIPTDENGPGAQEARAAHYIDRALAGPLASSRAAYANGLAAIDAYGREKKGAAFARLSAADQDAILAEMEQNKAPGFAPNAAAFFNLVRAHTIEGTFCDPYYGGNANFVGWDMIRYPGVRVIVAEEDQRMSAKPKPTRVSAYDESMFTTQGGGHGHKP
jgi:gluconate 2-dehydrogenase gamma chain